EEEEEEESQPGRSETTKSPQLPKFADMYRKWKTNVLETITESWNEKEKEAVQKYILSSKPNEEDIQKIGSILDAGKDQKQMICSHCFQEKNSESINPCVLDVCIRKRKRDEIPTISFH